MPADKSAARVHKTMGFLVHLYIQRFATRLLNAMANGAPSPLKARFTTVKAEAVHVINNSTIPSSTGKGITKPRSIRKNLIASIIDIP